MSSDGSASGKEGDRNESNLGCCAAAAKILLLQQLQLHRPNGTASTHLVPWCRAGMHMCDINTAAL